MPRSFTESESAAIREGLLAAGAESFARRGLRGTTVESLARSAGISKGAFYGFFDSKEDVFLELVTSYEMTRHAEIEAAVRADVGRGLELLLDYAIHATTDNPLVVVAMSEEGLALLRSMTGAQREAFLRRDELLVGRVLAVLAEAGVELKASPSLLLGLLRSLVFLGWHRADIGDELADEVTSWLAPTLRAALLSGVRS